MSLLFLLYQLFVFGVRNGYQPYDYFLNNDTRAGHCEIPLRSQDNWSPELFGKKLQQQDLLIVLSSPYVGQDTKMRIIRENRELLGKGFQEPTVSNIFAAGLLDEWNYHI
jgi:hypothetical protein|tara:strand:- start:184 stop:513 length:330 start_codon:yes stop_codon:yes gene_type:complete